jgi:hypothetical protein
MSVPQDDVVMPNEKAVVFCALSVVLVASPWLAASEPGRTLAATLDVYAFPQKGQAAEQQSQDEAACYDWATANTGSDPFAAQQAQTAAAQQADQQVKEAQGATRGAGVGGAVKGAAVGAIVGEVADGDTGKSAAAGAAVGLVASRRSARAASGRAQQQAVAEGNEQIEASATEIANFKKAFSACLEAKDYLVKY